MRSTRFIGALLLCAAPAAAQTPRVRTTPNPVRPVNSAAARRTAQGVVLMADLAVEGIRHNSGQHSVDVLVRNAGTLAAPECQVRLEVMDGGTVSKQVIQTLPATPPGGNQTLNFATNGWDAQAASASGFRVVVNTAMAFNETSLANNTLFTLVSPPKPTGDGGVFLSADMAADLVVSSVQRVPGQNALRVRITNQGPRADGGQPTVTVYALRAWQVYTTQNVGYPATYDSLVVNSGNAASQLDKAWATRQGLLNGLASGASAELVIPMPAAPPEGPFWVPHLPFGNAPLGSYSSSKFAPATFAASVFYVKVHSTLEVIDNNNAAFAGPFGS